jgi:aspartyl-tRNA(Asn)/glutamyl-tRNA(Gln) amidotransferase subunit B
VVRLAEEYGLPKEDILILTRDRAVSEYFAACAADCQDRVRLGRWIIRDLFSLLNESRAAIGECPIEAGAFARLVNLVASGEITDAMGRSMLRAMFERKCGPEELMKDPAYRPVQDPEALGKAVEEVLAEHPEAVSKIGSGTLEPLNFLIGRVLRKTGGKADAKKVKALLRERLGI